MGFKKEIVYIKTNLLTQQIYFISKLPLKKLRTVRKCFLAPFRPFFGHFLLKFGAVWPSKSLGHKIFLAAP